MSFYFISFECPFHKIPILNRYERPCSQDRISGTGPGGACLAFYAVCRAFSRNVSR